MFSYEENWFRMDEKDSRTTSNRASYHKEAPSKTMGNAVITTDSLTAPSYRMRSSSFQIIFLIMRDNLKYSS